MSSEVFPITQRNEMFEMSDEQVREAALLRRRKKYVSGVLASVLGSIDTANLNQCLGTKEHIRYRSDFDSEGLAAEYQQPFEPLNAQEVDAVLAAIRTQLLPDYKPVTAAGPLSTQEAA